MAVVSNNAKGEEVIPRSATEEPGEKSLKQMNREELEARATTAGVADPASFKNMDELRAAIEGGTSEPAGEVATASVEDEIRAHLADPANVPLPEGVQLNFGDPEPFRVVES